MNFFAKKLSIGAEETKVPSTVMALRQYWSGITAVQFWHYTSKDMLFWQHSSGIIAVQFWDYRSTIIALWHYSSGIMTAQYWHYCSASLWLLQHSSGITAAQFWHYNSTVLALQRHSSEFWHQVVFSLAKWTIKSPMTAAMATPALAILFRTTGFEWSWHS